MTTNATTNATTNDTIVISARYSTWAALARDAPSLTQGMFARLELQVAQFARVDVELELPDGESVTLAGDVVTVVPGQAVALQWRPEAREQVERVLRAAAAAHPSDVATADDPVCKLAPEAGDAGDDGLEHFPDRESLQAQIEAMTVQDKRTAALHGRKEMRLLLVRDHNKSIHPFVVKNPAIALDEVEQIARMTGVNPEVLHAIAQNREWTRSANVVRHLIKNPKTPMPDALALLDKLPAAELKAIAKSGNVRGAIQMAARKRVLGP